MPALTGEIVINTTVPDRQGYVDTVQLANGTIVVTWTDDSETGGPGIRYRLFSASGEPMGSDLAANAMMQGDQQYSRVTAVGGGFVITWQDSPDQGRSANILARAFDANGNPVGDEFTVNTTTTGRQTEPYITTLESGGYVITWSDDSRDISDPLSQDVYAQIFDASGTRVGGEIVLNATRDNGQRGARLDALNDGGFVVTWVDFSRSGGDMDGSAVRGQRFDANGNRVGMEFLVNTKVDGSQYSGDVTATSDGGFVIVYADSSLQGDQYSLRMQRFGADGAKTGAEVVFEGPSAIFVGQPQVVALSSGGVAVVWQASRSTGPDTQGSSIWVQEFDASGQPVGQAELVNQVTTGSQNSPSVALLDGGRLFISWEDSSGRSGAGANSEVVGRIFQTTDAGTPPGPPSTTPSPGNDILTGTDGDDFIDGLGGNDLIFGGAGNDRLIGGSGSDRIDGGAGFDIAFYLGLARQYGLFGSLDGTTRITGGPEGGTDILTAIEQAGFLDGILTFDVESLAAQLMRLYDTVLNRVPDLSGFEFLLGRLQGGAISLVDLATSFFNSQEFQDRFGALTDRQFVEQLYRFALDRDGDAQGIQTWIDALNGGGLSRAQVLLEFSESEEHRALTADTLAQGLFIPDPEALIIARLYDAAFDRLPDVGGLAVWKTALEGGMSLKAIAEAFQSSAEFQARYGNLTDQQFVEQLYRSTLDREGDPQGIQTWIDALSGGLTRGDVLLAFSESAEHIALTRDLWLGGVRYEGYVEPAVASPFDVLATDAFAVSKIYNDGPLVLPDDGSDDTVLSFGHNDGRYDSFAHVSIQAPDDTTLLPLFDDPMSWGAAGNHDPFLG